MCVCVFFLSTLKMKEVTQISENEKALKIPLHEFESIIIIIEIRNVLFIDVCYSYRIVRAHAAENKEHEITALLL